jgi:hypothetical protein
MMLNDPNKSCLVIGGMVFSKVCTLRLPHYHPISALSEEVDRKEAAGQPSHMTIEIDHMVHKKGAMGRDRLPLFMTFYNCW